MKRSECSFSFRDDSSMNENDSSMNENDSSMNEYDRENDDDSS